MEKKKQWLPLRVERAFNRKRTQRSIMKWRQCFCLCFWRQCWGIYDMLDTIHMCNSLQNIRNIESPNIRYWKIVEVDIWENSSKNYQVTALIPKVKMAWVKYLTYAFVGDKNDIQRNIFLKLIYFLISFLWLCSSSQCIVVHH